MTKRGRKSALQDFRLPLHHCPTCRHLFTAAGGLRPTPRPGPGDVSVCCACASIAIYTDDLQLRPPTAAEREALLADSEVQKARAVVLRILMQDAPRH